MKNCSKRRVKLKEKHWSNCLESTYLHVDCYGLLVCQRLMPLANQLDAFIGQASKCVGALRLTETSLRLRECQTRTQYERNGFYFHSSKADAVTQHLTRSSALVNCCQLIVTGRRSKWINSISYALFLKFPSCWQLTFKFSSLTQFPWLIKLSIIKLWNV